LAGATALNTSGHELLLTMMIAAAGWLAAAARRG